MPKGKIITTGEVLGPLFRFLERKSPDARSIVGEMVAKEINRLNARPAAKAPKAKAKAAAPRVGPAGGLLGKVKVGPAGGLLGMVSNFGAAKGTKAPKPAAKKSHKKKPSGPVAGGGENSAGETPLE